MMLKPIILVVIINEAQAAITSDFQLKENINIQVLLNMQVLLIKFIFN